MSYIADIILEADTACHSRVPGFISGFGRVSVAHRFSFLCYVFVLFVFVLCLVNPILKISLDCPFLIASSVFSRLSIASSVFSNVYLLI